MKRKLSLPDSIPQPQKVEAGNHTFAIHQPLIESWRGDEPERRAAVAMEQPCAPAPACGAIPTIYITLKPSSPNVLHGKPGMHPISKTHILYVTNSPNHLSFNTGGRKYCLRLTGRWFATPIPDGPRNFPNSDVLPPDFAITPVAHPPMADIPGSATGAPQAGRSFSSTDSSVERTRFW